MTESPILENTRTVLSSNQSVSKSNATKTKLLFLTFNHILVDTPTLVYMQTHTGKNLCLIFQKYLITEYSAFEFPRYSFH
jgi:hypothetical protein